MPSNSEPSNKNQRISAGNRNSAKKPQTAAARKRAEVAARQSSNRTQWIIIGAAVAVIALVVTIGVIISSRKSATQAAGYGTGSATATFAAGAITVGAGAAVTIDLFEDAICPACAAFERQYGQQIAKAVDEKKLTVIHHPLTFLDRSSASRDYSSRGAAAMMCVAANSGGTAGVFQAFHTRIFDADIQPAEGSASDHDNAFLAQLALTAGADQAAATCITDKTMAPTVVTAMATATDTLNTAVGGVSSPVVLHGGVQVDTSNTDWLTQLVG